MQSSGLVICTRLDEEFTKHVVMRPYESRKPVILPEVASYVNVFNRDDGSVTELRRLLES